MAGFWQGFNHAAAGNATVTITAPTGNVAAGQVLRLRSMTVSCATAASVVQVLDGASVVFQLDFAGANSSVSLPALDVRASVGNNLVIQTTGNAAAADVNVTGDYVPIGYPALMQ